MKILAIETSCDETAMAILEIKKEKNARFVVLSNVISSQAKLHAKYGGVYPSLAKREHQKNLPIVFKKTLRQAQSKQKFEKPDLIAITIGPGLEPCLWAGINFAKDLAKKIKKPIVPVNHIEAHIVASFVHSNFQLQNNTAKMEKKKSSSTLISNFKKKFPVVCLVVSGGHTQLILIDKIRNRKKGKASFSPFPGSQKYKIIGETKDDAAGECFDKTARVIGLEYPGGPAIAQQAKLWKSKSQNLKFHIKLPRPMINQKNYDFSFSGLKTAVLYDFKSRTIKMRKSKQYIQEMSAEIQQAIIDVLIRKTIKAAKDYKAKTIVLAGGVSANNELRKQLEKKIEKDLLKIQYLKPDIKLCTDNAVMVAINGYFNRKSKLFNEKRLEKIKADANLKI